MRRRERGREVHWDVGGAEQLHKRVVFHCLYVRNGNGGGGAQWPTGGARTGMPLSVCLFDRKYDRLGGTGGTGGSGWVGKKEAVGRVAEMWSVRGDAASSTEQSAFL